MALIMVALEPDSLYFVLSYVSTGYILVEYRVIWSVTGGTIDDGEG
jgi:hypothetical protein